MYVTLLVVQADMKIEWIRQQQQFLTTNLTNYITLKSSFLGGFLKSCLFFFIYYLADL